MKEITYEDWQKNPTPRMMWCWNDDINEKRTAKVVYMIKSLGAFYPVLTVIDDDYAYTTYKHCAEIEEPKTRRMTNKELSRWLREKPSRECKYLNSEYICSTFEYREYKQDEEVHEDMRIREDDSEWQEPLVEVEE